MECRNELCLYQDAGECTLGEIEVNEMGVCDSCINISLDNELLIKAKERQHLKLECRDIFL